MKFKRNRKIEMKLLEICQWPRENHHKNKWMKLIE